MLGWAPIKEYTFFVLQTLAMGLLVMSLVKRLWMPDQSVSSLPADRRLRLLAAGVVGAIWLCSTVLLDLLQRLVARPPEGDLLHV